MKQVYTLNYFKIYLWKILGLISGFASMLIVIPRLTKDQNIYGIYAICVSLSVYLSYADIGFLSAGQKYAAEHYAKKDTISEVKVLAFVHFVLFLFVLIFATTVFGLSFKPSVLFNNFSPENTITASRILLILAFSSFIVVLQRFSQAVFTIRIEDYVYQRIEVVFNLIKILSVFYFFRPGHYDIVSYYFFFQLMSLISCLVSISIIKKRYNYNLGLLMSNFRFSKSIYNSIHKLAFSALFVTVMWILYYEMDTIIISKLYGTTAIAIYAIGITILSFTRSLYGTLFGPFLVRINHFAGQQDMERLDVFLFDIIRLTFPLSIIPGMTLVIMMPSLIVSWVGIAYESSILIAQFLITLVLFYCFTNPLSYLIIAKEKFRAIYISSFTLTTVFFVTFFLLKDHFGVLAMAIAKSLSILFYVSILIYIGSQFLMRSLYKLVFSLLFKILLPIGILLAILFFTKSLWAYSGFKSVAGVIKTASIGGIASLVAILIFYMTDVRSRDLLGSLYKTIFTNFSFGRLLHQNDRLTNITK